MINDKSTRMKLNMPRPLRLIILLMIFTTNHLLAQESIGIRINTLTSAERDLLVQTTHGAGEIHVAYACVPAGIIVFAANAASTSRESLRTKAMTALAPVVTAARIESVEITLQAAETACENARGQ